MRQISKLGPTTDESRIKCSFCFTSAKGTKTYLIQGPAANICFECILSCIEIDKEHRIKDWQQYRILDLLIARKLAGFHTTTPQRREPQ